eukprot:TRINITY_DN74525_c0_g1_i1.p1 TRINITY_DN74525_c0_g1~~TRINITY_DN74525_c0_g1_i1.p1  ORF type:complete len:213 (-),score=24.33 TRINITY_DN74525_c0_g1_i1:307-852(-)
MRAPSRMELQHLLELAARFGAQPDVVLAVSSNLSEMGVPLDWDSHYDCSANFGRYALDAALNVAIEENPVGEGVAIYLLDLGIASRGGSTERLNANPLLRKAARKGMLRLVEKLILQCGANIDALDPRFHYTALDQAVFAGHERVALRLLDMGASPNVGRGREYLLARARNHLRERLLSYG